MAVEVILRAALLLCLCLFVHGITLEEGLRDEKKYIFYDISRFSTWIHGAIALCITYGSLTATILLVHLVVYITGSKTGRHYK
ncbi:hypothetical protein FGIG_10795 [Fasciola gigantica]|uniref:Uncharacterized protein n=2 Tax=Fasciola TaxID=6191 RepID=A0A4E0QYY3_FASHE|nr:hypothetical protein D915_010704 [Fasciola hepatica]TPP39684.1 hypothetical protein FGIG_10795 [Fasciola gigantica]